MEGTGFHDRVVGYVRQFNNEKSLITPLTSINTKSLAELKDLTKDLFISLYSMCRLHYMSMTRKIFSLEEMCIPLRDIKPMSITQSLKVFKRPNHKDRFSYLVYYCTSHPSVFAQILYYVMSYSNSHVNSNLSQDDINYFIYNSFPSFYNFFITKNDRANAIELALDLLKLHFYIQGKTIKENNAFIKDFVFSVFLSTNPIKFYENSIQPLIELFTTDTIEKQHKYMPSKDGCERTQFWLKTHELCTNCFNRMIECAPLLPTATRQLITALWRFESTDRVFWRIFILDTIVCKFIIRFHLVTNVTMAKNIQTEMHKMAEENNPLIDQMIEKFCINPNENVISDGVSEAAEIAERTSIYTPRDLNLLFIIVQKFVSIANGQNAAQLIDAFSGLEAPAIDDDSQYLLARPWKSEDITASLEIKKTFGFDEFVDITNTIDLSKVPFKSSLDLTMSMTQLTTAFTTPIQQLRVDTNSRKIETFSEAIQNASKNRKTMQELGSKASTALYFIGDALQKSNVQKRALSTAFIKEKVLPALIERYPNDFVYNDDNIFSPITSFSKLIDNLKNRVQALNLPENNGLCLRYHFFLDLFDKIDLHFGFQLMPNSVGSGMVFAKYIQENSKVTQDLGPYGIEILTKAAKTFQEISVYQKPSKNLKSTLIALSIMSRYDDEKLKFCIALSGNPQLVSFSTFLGGYLKTNEVVDLVLGEGNYALIKRLRVVLASFAHNSSN